MPTHLALLRGINVGGNNIIKMEALKTCFEGLGLKDVSTYIQSGNVCFNAPAVGRAQLLARIEQGLSKSFKYKASVVLRTQKELKDTLAKAPKGFGAQPAKYRYDFIFLKEPLTAAEALKSVQLKEGVDQVWAGKGVLYFARLIAKATQSRLNKVVGLPVYQSMTIRNWNTTTALAKKLEGKGI